MKSKVWAVILGTALVLCIGLSMLLMQPGQKANVAEIWSEGELVERVSLSVDREIQVQTQRGTNTVTVRDGKIAVTAASCPDHYCISRGFCDGGAQIVCLPNRLVIKFVTAQDTDMVVG